MNKTKTLYEQAKKIIPGGTQLLSKRPEMYAPDVWPAYYMKAKGCYIVDLDGKRYIDMSTMGIGSCVLGYADSDVDNAVINIIKNGSMSSLNPPEEVELAKQLIKLHPWAEMVRFTRSGGEAMTVAVRIVRAKTKKDTILFCGYHGWHDWYLSSNLANDSALNGHLLPGLSPIGVPKGLRGTAIPFRYNNSKEFIDLLHTHKDSIAGVVMEPLRNHYPTNNFLQIIREETKRRNIPLVFDEITSGFRYCCGGAHLTLGITPNIAVFSKALGNGFPIAAIIGTKSIMDVAQNTFISSTMWTERIGPAAALAVLKKYRKHDVSKRLISNGIIIQKNWKSIAEESDVHIKVEGMPPLCHFEFKYKNSLAIKTLFTQLMLKKGFLASTSYYASYAHTELLLKKYLTCFKVVMKRIKNAINTHSVEKIIKNMPCDAGFKRIT